MALAFEPSHARPWSSTHYAAPAHLLDLVRQHHAFLTRFLGPTTGLASTCGTRARCSLSATGPGMGRVRAAARRDVLLHVARLIPEPNDSTPPSPSLGDRSRRHPRCQDAPWMATFGNGSTAPRET